MYCSCAFAGGCRGKASWGGGTCATHGDGTQHVTQPHVPLVPSPLGVDPHPSLPANCHFNIVSFGSGYTKLFEEPKPYSDHTLSFAAQHVAGYDANMGGTEILLPLRDVRPLLMRGCCWHVAHRWQCHSPVARCERGVWLGRACVVVLHGCAPVVQILSAPASPRRPRSVLLFTDGEVTNTRTVIDTVRSAHSSTGTR